MDFEETPDKIADRTYAIAKLVEALKDVERGSPIMTLAVTHIKAVTESVVLEKGTKNVRIL